MYNFLKKIYSKEVFNPGILGVLINPFFFARRSLYKSIMAHSTKIKGRLLDVGCGNKPYKDLFTVSEYIGLEIASAQHSQADCFYNGKRFQFGNDAFDSIICNQVVEHVFNPDEFFEELRRVLKPGGYLLLTVPFVWDEHEQPNDYARYSSYGISFMLEKHGFKLEYSQKTLNDIRVFFQLINLYIYKKTLTKYAYVNLLSSFFLMAPFNILGSVLYMMLPGNNDFYMDNTIFARKKE